MQSKIKAVVLGLVKKVFFSNINEILKSLIPLGIISIALRTLTQKYKTLTLEMLFQSKILGKCFKHRLYENNDKR